MGHFHKYIFHLAFTKISHSQAILIITSQGKRNKSKNKQMGPKNLKAFAQQRKP